MQNPCYCFITAKSLNVLRDLTLSVAFYSKFNNSGLLWKFQGFLSENPFFCKNPISESFEKSHCSVRIWHQIGSLFPSHSPSIWLAVSVAFDIKLTKFISFQKFRFHFRKNHLFFENPICREILLIQSNLRQLCYLYPFNKSSRYSLGNPIFFF